MFGKLKRMFSAVPRFLLEAAGVTKATIEAVVLVVVVVILDVYVIGNQSLINTTVGAPGYSITSVVVPILQAALLIIAIFGAIGLIYYAAKHSFGGK